MDIWTLINEIPFAFIEAIIILALYLKFTSTELDFRLTSLWKIVLFIPLYIVVSFWASVYLPMGYHTIVILAFIIITLGTLTSNSLLTSSVVVAIITTLLIITEFLTQSILNIVLKVDFTTTMNEGNLKFIYSCIAKLLQVILVLLVYKTKVLDRRLRFVLKTKNSISSYLVLQVFFIGLFVFSLNYGIGIKEHLALYNFLLIAIFIILFIIGYYVLREMEHLISIQNRFKVQDEHLRNMETMLNIIRTEKHDFANHLNTVNAMCALDRPDTTKRINDYISNLCGSLNTYQFYSSGNTYIDGLLAVKSNQAYERGIEFEVEFENTLDSLDIIDHDLVSIFSNIIDNAFAAFPKEQDKKIISVISYIEDNNYNISISNNGLMIDGKNKDKIFEKGFSTKSKRNKEHGFGLYIINQIVKKNKGRINVISNEFETEFIIMFPLKNVAKKQQTKLGYQLNN